MRHHLNKLELEIQIAIISRTNQNVHSPKHAINQITNLRQWFCVPIQLSIVGSMILSPTKFST
jgi:hypothetical protein